MPVTPSGILSVPTDALRTAISNSSTFQAMVSAANAAAALTSIYPVARSNAGALAYSRPFALVSPPEQIHIHRGAYATGRLWLLIERATPLEHIASGSHADAFYDFSNIVGGILSDVTTYCEGTAGTLAIQPGGIVAEAGIQRSNVDETDDYFQASYWVTYGPTFNDS